MTTPIQKQKRSTSIPVQEKRDWCCGTPITGPHVPGCAYEPRDPDEVAEPPRPYGFKKRREFDLDLPTGERVRVRQLSLTQAMDLGVLDMGDLFGPALLKDLNADQAEEALSEEQVGRALLDPERRTKILRPLDRVLEAAVVCPKVVLEGDTTDDQINVKDIDLIEKSAIFNAVLPDELKPAALEEQHDALKSVRESEAGVRGLPDGEDVQPASE